MMKLIGLMAWLRMAWHTASASNFYLFSLSKIHIIPARCNHLETEDTEVERSTGETSGLRLGGYQCQLRGMYTSFLMIEAL